MSERKNTVDALVFPGARDDELALSQQSSSYAPILAAQVTQGRQYIEDPDIALHGDTEAYRKIETEPTIVAKLLKRAGRVASADWSVSSKDERYAGVAKIIEQLIRKIRRFTISLRTLSKNSTLQGRALARIDGDIFEQELQGDIGVRNWWAPTKLTNVSKQRFRINHVPDEELVEGESAFYWAVQDLRSYKWYRIGGMNSSVGLRAIDYVEAIFGEDETDLGYAHGLMRALKYKWFMLSRGWMYAIEGANAWAFGKTVVTSPRSLMSAELPGSNSNSTFEANQTLVRQLAAQVSQMMRNDVVALTEGQTVDVLARPDSGSEAVTNLINMISDDFSELILGRRKGENHEWDIDPDVIVMDRLVLEDAVNNGLIRAVVYHNRENFSALGWTCEEILDNVSWSIARQAVLDTEVSGRNMMVAQSLGVPIDRNDVFKKLSLTPIENNHPDATFSPQAGQPISGVTRVQLDNDPLIDTAPTVEPQAPEGTSSPPPPLNRVRAHL